MTSDLIDRLSEELKPRRGRLVAGRLGLGLLVGTGGAFLGVAGALGLNHHMADAAGHAIFWIKLAYTAAIAAVGLWSVERLSRPGGSARGRLPWIAAPVLCLVGLAVLQLIPAPPAERARLMMGQSASVCPWYILLTATPVFLALVWAIRGLAPTNLRAAGAVAGLTAGGAGAAVYCLHCPESAAAFVAIWYSLGIALTGALGALLGPRLLRW